MYELSWYIYFTFGVTVLLTTGIFYVAANKSKTVLAVIAIWMVIQSALAFSGFYTVTDTLPPRFMLLVLPPILLIIFIFISKKGRSFIDNLNMKWLTIIHIVRLPVEIILYWLFLAKWIPALMTFEGRNFDILSGITVMLIYFLAFRRAQVNKRLLVAWNIVTLLLVFNVIINGLLSSPSPLQQFAFEQPNVAVLHFPFNLLPSLIVPLVIFSHLASLRQLWRIKSSKKVKDNAGVIMFPPLLFSIAILIALFIRYNLSVLLLPSFLGIGGWFFIGFGLLMLLSAVNLFSKNKTTVNPAGVSTKVISTGIYQYTRNPMYIAFTLIYIGVMFLNQAGIGLLLLFPLLFIVQKGIIEREEKYLLQKFGNTYSDYLNRVRRWF